MTIRNPIEWATDQFKLAGLVVGSASRAGIGTEDDLAAPLPEVRQIEVADLKDVLARGLDDFAAYRTDVIFLCIVYPVIGLLLGRQRQPVWLVVASALASCTGDSLVTEFPKACRNARTAWTVLPLKQLLSRAISAAAKSLSASLAQRS